MTDVIYNVKNTQFSIARYYGGVKINGVFYVYNPIEDSLTKESILKKTKMKKKKDRNDVALFLGYIPEYPMFKLNNTKGLIPSGAFNIKVTEEK